MATHGYHSLFGTRHHGGRSALMGMGAGIGLALLGKASRKLIIQGATASAGSWEEGLKKEHQAALALFDKLAETRDGEAGKRTMLLGRLKHMLGKHAFEEENTVYPAMRDAGLETEADSLNKDHGYIKQYLYDLAQMADDNATFQRELSKFRDHIGRHMAEEENELFPRLRRALSDSENKKLTAMMNKEGMAMA